MSQPIANGAKICSRKKLHQTSFVSRLTIEYLKLSNNNHKYSKIIHFNTFRIIFRILIS